MNNTDPWPMGLANYRVSGKRGTELHTRPFKYAFTSLQSDRRYESLTWKLVYAALTSLRERTIALETSPSWGNWFQLESRLGNCFQEGYRTINEQSREDERNFLNPISNFFRLACDFAWLRGSVTETIWAGKKIGLKVRGAKQREK